MKTKNYFYEIKMTSSLPTLSDYQQILQNPRINISDLRYKLCLVEKDQMGLPRVRSGGFALTYRLENGSQKWALRCFHKAVTEREERYAAICQYLSSQRSDILIPVEYIKQGVLFKGNWFPITIMDWVEGDTLDKFLYKYINNPTLVANIGINFLRVIDELNKLNIAHGDLSHLNILIRNGKMILVDYDGMFVPELAGKKSTELGNPHFQHPRRSSSDFDATLDRFSEIVIYLTLRGLKLNPSLYNVFGKGGEGLIFKQADFTNPNNSRLLVELEKITELKELIQQFRSICLGNLRDVPKFDDFLENRPVVIQPSTRPVGLSPISNQFLTFDATNRGTLLENEGEYVTVIGQITKVHQSVTIKQTQYALFNVGIYPRATFTVVLWSETLNMLSESGIKPIEYENKWVAVTGLISIYGDTPQIVLESPANIEIISEKEAKDRLTGIPKDVIATPLTAVVTAPSGRTPKQRIPISTVNLDSVVRSQANQGKSTNILNIQRSSVEKPSSKSPRPSVNPIEKSNEISNKLDHLYSDSTRFSKSIASGTKQTKTQPRMKYKKKGFFERLFDEIDRIING